MSAKLKNAIKAVNKAALIYGSVSTLALSGVAFAQEEAGMMEEIEVTGIRSALKNAVDIKRNSTAVVDAVSAEDVGKFPDSDVGEALGRIPGISVGRSFGQGASVSIRGAAPQMTLTQLNGQNVASTGWFDQLPVDRSFNYSLLPSELIGGIEVYKSSQADLNEGGVGGNVIVKTRKPLDLDANTVFASIKAKQGTISDDLAPEFSGLYSWKNDAETFGLLVAGSVSEGDYVRRGIEADFQWWGDVAPSTFTQYREQEAIDVTLQFAPTENLTFDFEYTGLSLTGDNANASLYIFTDASNALGFAPSWDCHSTNAAGNCTSTSLAAEDVVDGDLAAGWASGSPGNETFIQTWGRRSEMTSDTFDLSAEFEGDGYTVSGSIGSTESDGGTDLTFNYQHYPSLGDPMSIWAGSIDLTGKSIGMSAPVGGFDGNVDLTDLGTTTTLQTWSVGGGPNSDEEVYAQIDVEFDVDLGAINSFKTGIRYTDHDVERTNYEGIVTDPAPIANADIYSGSVELGGGIYMPRANLGAMEADVRANLDDWVFDRKGYADLNEENLAIYGMFTFEADALRGNFGLRYIDTEVTRKQYDYQQGVVDQYSFNNDFSTTLSSYSSDYSEVLPSANIMFDLTEDVVLRFSAAQALARPNYDDMLVTYAGYNDDRPNNQALKIGSESLAPMKSSQADLGIEWYYGDGNLLSATYFLKSISNFTASTIAPNMEIGIVDPGGNIDNWRVEVMNNSNGAEIEGLELQWQHAFDNGFGFAANYTYSNANVAEETYADQIGMFTESSQHTANLVGYWENDVFSARAAYNYRSEYMVRDGAFYYGNRMHDDFGTLDLSFGWDVTENIGLTFEVTNLLEEDSNQYGVASTDTTDLGIKNSLQAGFPAWSYEGEATYQLGASFKF